LLNKKNKAKTENKRYIFVFINIVYKW
jgi:hypothetical protein